MTAKTCHKWIQTFLYDFDDFVNEERGGKQKYSFYDVYPVVEIEAQDFVVSACSPKYSSVTVADVPYYIDTHFYEINNLKRAGDGLIHSIETCRLDLRRRDANHNANSSRPYFEGHEHTDVVAPETISSNIS